MGRIVDKVPLDRLQDKELKISLLCPYCKSTRITLAGAQSSDALEGVDCPKCEAHILLDSMSLVVVKEGRAAAKG